MHLLKDLNQVQGITIIMVTHEPEMAEFAHRIVHFKDGRVENDSQNQKFIHLLEEDFIIKG